MKTITQTLLSLFLIALTLGLAQAGAPDDIATLENQRIAAYIGGDTAPLEKIFADDLTYVHSSGISDNKRQVIDSFTSGDLKIHKFDREDLKVRDVGDAMLATGTGSIEITMKGKDLKFKLRYSALYVKRTSGWQVVYYQGTRLPQ